MIASERSSAASRIGAPSPRPAIWSSNGGRTFWSSSATLWRSGAASTPCGAADRGSCTTTPPTRRGSTAPAPPKHRRAAVLTRNPALYRCGPRSSITRHTRIRSMLSISFATITMSTRSSTMLCMVITCIDTMSSMVCLWRSRTPMQYLDSRVLVATHLSGSSACCRRRYSMHSRCSSSSRSSCHSCSGLLYRMTWRPRRRRDSKPPPARSPGMRCQISKAASWTRRRARRATS
mmetsp:Transcript_111705/g.322875  ORF Transcript_111705/g.322875 Transcript_111705/m.322875 type:complete len:234 (+) Transcript_111705:1163-1864(+)